MNHEYDTAKGEDCDCLFMMERLSRFLEIRDRLAMTDKDGQYKDMAEICELEAARIAKRIRDMHDIEPRENLPNAIIECLYCKHAGLHEATGTTVCLRGSNRLASPKMRCNKTDTCGFESMRDKADSDYDFPKKRLDVEILSVTDPRDGKSYQTKQVGKLAWMTENLKYLDKDKKIGDAYNNDIANLGKYGCLYNWETAKKACPEGWRLPTKEEWEEIELIVGRKNLVEELNLLPGGYGSSDGIFNGVGSYGYWWSASEGDRDEAYSRYMSCYSEYAVWYGNNKSYLFNVRCVKDA